MSQAAARRQPRRSVGKGRAKKAADDLLVRTCASRRQTSTTFKTFSSTRWESERHPSARATSDNRRQKVVPRPAQPSSPGRRRMTLTEDAARITSERPSVLLDRTCGERTRLVSPRGGSSRVTQHPPPQQPHRAGHGCEYPEPRQQPQQQTQRQQHHEQTGHTPSIYRNTLRRKRLHPTTLLMQSGGGSPRLGVRSQPQHPVTFDLRTHTRRVRVTDNRSGSPRVAPPCGRRRRLGGALGGG